MLTGHSLRVHDQLCKFTSSQKGMYVHKALTAKRKQGIKLSEFLKYTTTGQASFCSYVNSQNVYFFPSTLSYKLIHVHVLKW